MNLKADELLNQRYRILRVLSDKGGMGVIYQAHDQNLNGTVVIKQSRFTEPELQRQYPGWPPERVRSQAEFLRKAFEREAKLLFGLRHNALPRVLDYFATPDGNQFFVMEFIPGKDFGDLLHERLAQNQGPFPLTEVLAWAEQMLDVLEYLHTQFDPPIIHRDIKPQNMKLMPNGQVILLDFGLAKGARPGMSVADSILGGTPHYAPLEQINRKTNQEQPTDPRSDIYSFAVTLHHLLTGELPPDAIERLQAVAQGEPDPLRPLHEVAPTVSITVSAALQRAAAVFAKGRLATAVELRQLLWQPAALASPTIITPPPEPEPTTIVRPRPVQPQSFVEKLDVGIELEMIYIPGGSFLMGSQGSGRYPDSCPQHRVTLSPFFIGKYPVTQAQWEAVKSINPSHFKGGDLPVESVDWYQATKFCKAISMRTGNIYRLPTEAEWEYVCRAGSIGDGHLNSLGQYAWCGVNSSKSLEVMDGEDIPELVIHDDEAFRLWVQDNGGQTNPVGQKNPNNWGVYDMLGNVCEWCQDWYNSLYYSLSPENDPQGPDSGEYRVVRGGSWASYAWECNFILRGHPNPEAAGSNVGFRVVCVTKTS